MLIHRSLPRIMILGESFKIQRKNIRKRNLWGETDITKRVITIDSSLSETGFRDILGHEVMHAIVSLTGLNLSMNHEQEEKFCDAAGRAIMIFLEENSGNE